MTPAERIFCAVDTPDLAAAQTLAQQVRGVVGGLKLGLEFFAAHGPAGVQAVTARQGVPLFLDLKFHDIPNTVAGAVRAAVGLTPAFLTVHAAGGAAMLRAAAEAATDEAARLGVSRPRLLAVTVLTSLDATDLTAIGVTAATVAAQVLHLATLAQACGIDGVVCSPHEVAGLRAQVPADFLLMVPGIRPSGSAAGDQKRAATPAAALAAGADRLVIGRPITQAADPRRAAERIAAEIAAG